MRISTLLPITLLALIACDRPSGELSAVPVSPAAPATEQAPAAAVHGGAAIAAPTAEGGLGGVVAERIDAAGYTYLRLKTGDGEAWAAVPVTDVAVGAQVTISSPMPMQDFESKTLNRKFERIYFGTLGGPAASPRGAAEAAAAAIPGHPAGVGQAAAADVEIAPGSIEKAEGAGGRTVAELFAQKATLSGQAVSVRGKVVKFTAGVMGTNWIHLRDGSGSAEAKDHDITVTSDGITAVGQVITITGPVVLDKDFGAGYSYDVLIEGAKIAQGP